MLRALHCTVGYECLRRRIQLLYKAENGHENQEGSRRKTRIRQYYRFSKITFPLCQSKDRVLRLETQLSRVTQLWKKDLIVTSESEIRSLSGEVFYQTTLIVLNTFARKSKQIIFGSLSNSQSV